jgi:hypothetical protein
MPTKGIIDENGLIISQEFFKMPPAVKKVTKVKNKPTSKTGRSGSSDSHTSLQSRSSTRDTKRKHDVPKNSSLHLTVKCPECNVVVRDSRLAKHIRKCHSGTVKPVNSTIVKNIVLNTLTKCIVCNAMVREDNMSKHLRKCHSGRTKIKRTSIKYAHAVKARVNTDLQPNGQYAKEAYLQSAGEVRYGDRYIGQTYRESTGRFGSLPLYDDYSEESGPE